MTWLTLNAPPLTLINPEDRPLALGVMGLLHYRLPEAAARPPRRGARPPADGYERLLRRLLDVAGDQPPLIRPERRDRAIAGTWALLRQVRDRRQAEMLALYYGLAAEPTRPLTFAQAGSVYDLSAAQARRLCQQAEAHLRAHPGLAELRRELE
jgi:hypothetical protein